MNKLTSERRAQILRALVEGNSIRSTCRMLDVSKNTVIKLLVEVGIVCSEYQDEKMRNLDCKRIQVDEIWAFCYAKEKNVPKEVSNRRGVGDVWTWTAICADTKICPSWIVGKRDALYADAFIKDLSERMKNRIQLTTDGRRVYLNAIEKAFGNEIDFAQLVKLYGKEEGFEKRYSPPKCLGTHCDTVVGNPDPNHVSTSFVERSNLTMRMGMRRFTRLTNAFSKKIENLECSIALHFMHYNFCRVHTTLKTTPAMAAGIADHVWDVSEIVCLLEQKEAKSK